MKKCLANKMIFRIEEKNRKEDKNFRSPRVNKQRRKRQTRTIEYKEIENWFASVT